MSSACRVRLSLKESMRRTPASSSFPSWGDRQRFAVRGGKLGLRANRLISTRTPSPLGDALGRAPLQPSCFIASQIDLPSVLSRSTVDTYCRSSFKMQSTTLGCTHPSCPAESQHSPSSSVVIEQIKHSICCRLVSRPRNLNASVRTALTIGLCGAVKW